MLLKEAIVRCFRICKLFSSKIRSSNLELKAKKKVILLIQSLVRISAENWWNAIKFTETNVVNCASKPIFVE